MRKLFYLSLLLLLTASSTGCFHRNACCGGLGGLFSWRPQQPTPTTVQYTQPCCCQPVQCQPAPVDPCCNPCCP